MSNSLEKSLFRLFIYIFVLALLPIFLFSQQLFLENGTPSHPAVLGYGGLTRNVIDLNGPWNYSLDGGKTWDSVHIPAAGNYEGSITYRRKFLVTAEEIDNSSFTFVSYGMNYQAEVFINETFIGRHEGGYTSFTFQVPDNVIQVGSENVIRVVVDNSLTYNSTIPVRPQVHGWKNYNGIVRDIFIAATPKVWIEHSDVSVESIQPKQVTLSVGATILSKDFSSDPRFTDKQFQIYTEISEAGTGIVVGKSLVFPVVPEVNREVSVHVSVPIGNAKFWSPESPQLYSAKIELQTVDGRNVALVDEVSITTGIRTITKEKSSILFNAAPISFRGVLYIEDTEAHGSAITYEKMERDVALIKNLGANAVRVGYHPPHPFFIQLCNRYGLVVLEEMPLFEVPSKIAENDTFIDLAKNYLKEMITRDKCEPSVIGWGLGTSVEFNGDRENNVILQLQRTAKSLDDRLTYIVSRGEKPDPTPLVDIAALQVLNGDTKVFKAQLISWKKSHTSQPVFVGGYGLPAEPENRNGYSDPMSQQAQARGILQRYRIITDEFSSGGFIETFDDFRSDRPVMRVKPLQVALHTQGIVELDREKKTAYDIVRSMYLGEKISALPIGSYVPPSPYTYVVIGLALLIIVAWLINGNRRFRESTRRAIFNSYNFFADIRDQFTLPLFHTTVTALIISTTFAIVASSVLYYFKSSQVLDYLLSYFLSDVFKRIIITMAWDPIICVSYLTGLMFLWFFVLTFLIQMLSVFAKVKIRLFHSYSIAVWTALPWAFFIPVGMILYRVLQSEPYVPWILVLIALMMVWVFFRTLKGVSVIYHVYTPKMYLVGLMVVIIVTGGLYVFWNYSLSLSAYSEFFFSTILPSFH